MRDEEQKLKEGESAEANIFLHHAGFGHQLKKTVYAESQRRKHSTIMMVQNQLILLNTK